MPWKVKVLSEWLNHLETVYYSVIEDFDNAESKAFEHCKKSLDNCLKYHQRPNAYFDKGMFYYLEGNEHDALEQVNTLLNRLKPNELEDLNLQAQFLKAELESELGLYADAVISLTNLIIKEPTHKDAYFERAIAYFELGKFDEAISDYLVFEMDKKEKETNTIFSIDYASGLVEGMKKGIKHEVGEMLPAWAPIMNVGLWTLMNNPHPTAKFITGTLACVALAGTYLVADQMVGELKDLVTNWKTLSERQRGELCGFIIGKYGVDVFAVAGSVKMTNAYRDLKKANNLLTFQVALADEANLPLIKDRFKGIEKCKKDQEYIQTKFGKNHYPELEIRDNLQKMGYVIPKRPEGIPENYIVRYSDKGCGLCYHDPLNPNFNNVRLMPGKSHSPNVAQQKPYVVQVKNGKTLNFQGEIVQKKDQAAHIPIDQFIYRP